MVWCRWRASTGTGHWALTLTLTLTFKRLARKGLALARRAVVHKLEALVLNHASLLS
jgi:hypothetical protein